MTTHIKLRITLLLAVGLLAACDQIPRQQAVPTLQPTAAVPTRAPTDTPAASSMEAEPTSAAPASSTTEPLPPTPLPSATPRPTSTSEPVQAAVNIQRPAEGDLFLVGSMLSASGFGQIDEGQAIWVSLLTIDGRLVGEMEAAVTAQGGNTVTWQAEFQLPPQAIGLMQLLITVRDGDGQVLAEAPLAIELGVDTESSDQYIIMDEPVQGQNAVADHFLLLRGFTVRPSANRVTVEVWTEECQTRISQVSFSVGGGGPWYGLPAIPKDITGPACVIAYTGARGEGNWREVQTTVSILSVDDVAANGIFMVQPRPETVFAPGATLTAFGVAFNAVNDEVSATVILADGQLLAQETAEVSPRGYWEVEITLPPDVEGEAAFSVITGQAGDFGHAEIRRLITIK